MDTRMISIVAAVATNGVIGKNNELPWRLKSDLKRFSQLTKNHCVIVGRKTHESIIQRLGKTLPNRTTIVITTQPNYQSPGCLIVHNFKEAIAVSTGKEVFIIGGAEIYNLALPMANRMYLTIVNKDIADGDAFFPDFDMNEWEIVEEQHFKASAEDEHEHVFQIFKRKKNSFVNLENARKTEQLAVMQRIQDRGECPFCAENLRKEHKNPILSESKHWILTHNQWRYDEAQLHLLLISTVHARNLNDLPSEAGKELLEALQWAEKRFNITSGGVAIRFGDIRYNGATIDHLHAHLIVPFQNPESADYKPVRFKIGAKKPRIG